MFRFQGRVFVNDSNWFVWEPSWDLMRPIDAFAWDGRKYCIVDTSFIKDPFSELFGFGTPEMKAKCEALTERYLSQIETAPDVKNAIIGAPSWMRDRWVVAKSSVDSSTWRAHLATINSRARTCRKQPRGNKFTKRTLLSDKR